MRMVRRVTGTRKIAFDETCREILTFLMMDTCSMWSEGTSSEWSLILSSMWTIVAKPFGPMSFWIVRIGCNTTPCVHGLPTWTVVGRMSPCHVTTTTFGCNTHCFDSQNEKWNDAGCVLRMKASSRYTTPNAWSMPWNYCPSRPPLEVWRKTWKKSIDDRFWKLL